MMKRKNIDAYRKSLSLEVKFCFVLCYVLLISSVAKSEPERDDSNPVVPMPEWKDLKE
jgi:hypothetical protein